MSDSPVTSSAASAWVAYQPTEDEPWNLRRVVHLHRRAGFAAAWSLLQRDFADGPSAAVDRLVLVDTSRGNGETDFALMSRMIGDAAEASNNPNRLKAWWLYRMLLSPDPLGERLALMWHNHFATSNRKVNDLHLMRQQNELFRKYARAPLGQLLQQVLKHPALLVWLDADANRKGHPNENLSRELMELFTLGIGHYEEADVKEAARALTGWSVADNRFQFKQARHDTSEKTVLGKRGRLDGDDLLRLLLDQPATSRRLAWRICRTFMGEGAVDDVALEQLAAGLRERHLDVGWAIGTVLRSRLFFSEQNMGSRIIGPVELVIGTLQCLEFCQPPPSTLLLAEWTSRMGQDLFYPPNVAGWSEGRAWLGSRTIIARVNFASALVEGRLWHPARAPDFWRLVNRHRPTSKLEEAVAWLAELMWGYAPETALRDVLAAVHAANTDKRFALAAALLMARPENHLA